MRLPRAPLFLAERLISQGGGLLFTALLARSAETEVAAAFFAAYAFAAVFQPILSNAIQPIAARHWRSGGLKAVIRIWAIMQAAAILTIGPLMWLAVTDIAAILLLHALLAPGLIMATPLAAEDRRQRLVLILIASTTTGVAARIAAYLTTGDLAFTAWFFAIEPVLGGAALLFASRRLAPSGPVTAAPTGFLRDAALMAFAMGLTTVFWRSPVLLADWFLSAEDVIALALAMQIVMGLCLPANALCQSLFGPLARGNHAALGVGVLLALSAGIAAPLFILIAGEPLLTSLYGPLGRSAETAALLLSPMACLAALWRLSHIAGGLNNLTRELAFTRFTAICGQAGLLVWLLYAPSAVAIAAITPLSMALAAIAAPLLTPGLAMLAREAATSAWSAAFQKTARRRALRLMFS